MKFYTDYYLDRCVCLSVRGCVCIVSDLTEYSLVAIIKFNQSLFDLALNLYFCHPILLPSTPCTLLSSIIIILFLLFLLLNNYYYYFFTNYIHPRNWTEVIPNDDWRKNVYIQGTYFPQHNTTLYNYNRNTQKLEIFNFYLNEFCDF